MARSSLLLVFVALICVLALTVARAQPPPRRRFGGSLRPPRSPPSRQRFEAGGTAAAAPATTTTELPPPLGPEPPREAATQSFCASSSTSSVPTLASPDPSVGGAFGAALALDGAGQVLVAGAPGEGLDPSLAPTSPQQAGGYAPVGTGAAYFATRQGSCRWSAPHFLAPPPPSSSDASSSSIGAIAFGASVAASGDGATLLVGAALLRKAEQGSAGSSFVRPIVFVADTVTGDRVRQEAGQEEASGGGGSRVDPALLVAKDAGAVAAAVLSGEARAAVAHGAATVVAESSSSNNVAVFSDVASVFVSEGSSGGFGRAGGLPLELPLASSTADGGLPLQLTGGLRLSLSSDGRTAVASLQALYARSTARGEKLTSPALVAGTMQVFSSGNGGSAFALQQRLKGKGGDSAGGGVWGAAHALSDDGLAVAVLEASNVNGAAGGDSVHVFRRAGAAAPFAEAELLSISEPAASLALSADGAVLAVGLASGRALVFEVGSAAPMCAFSAGGGGGGPAEVRLAAAGLRLVVSTPGAPARVFVLRSRPGGGGGLAACPSAPSQELGAGSGDGSAWRRALGVGAAGGSGSAGVAVSGSGGVAVVGAPVASLDERLPGAGGLFSYVVG